MSRVIRVLLSVIGVLGILTGIGIVLVGALYLGPKAEQAAGMLDQNLALAEDTLSLLAPNGELLASVSSLGDSATRLTNLLPETLMAVEGSLVQSATALEGTSRTLDELSGGITGIVLPDPEVGRNVRAANKTADQLRLLAGMVDAIQEVTSDVAERSAQLSPRFSRLEPILESTQNQIRQTRASLGSVPVALGVTGASAALGGLYALLGVLALALASVLGKLERATKALPSPIRRAEPGYREAA